MIDPAQATPLSRFVFALSKTGEWTVLDDGRIRKGRHCPLSFVAGAEYPGSFYNASLRSSFSMAWEEMRVIACAVDNKTPTPLRRLLLAATGAHR